MEDPFYPRIWSSARPRAPAAMSKTAGPAKVVSVPVRFVGSGEDLHRERPVAATAFDGAPTANTVKLADAALRIQRAFRGFLVRKNFRFVRSLGVEMDAIEREMKEREARLRRDGRERVRVSEALMSVLLRLDSVRGVRECRRKAIRRAIALQEAVDAIAAGKEAESTIEIQQALDTPPEAPDDGDQAGADAEGEGSFEQTDLGGDILLEEEVKQEGDRTAQVGVEESSLEAAYADSPLKEDYSVEGRATDVGSRAKEAAVEGSEDLERDGPEADDVTEASMMGDDDGSADVKTVESSATGDALPDLTPSLPSPEKVGGQGCGDNMRLVMERMVEDSRGLKGLVAELCERNEMQCRLMSGLLQRVEHLEKVVERMGRRKKRQQATGARKRHREL